MGTARYLATATLLPNGKVLVTGGDTGSIFLNSAELYDPANGTFSATGTMNAERSLHSATLLTNGKVLVSSGQTSAGPAITTELYDPASGTFTASIPLITPHLRGTATLLPNGKVLVSGGRTTASDFTNSAELYDIGSGTTASRRPLISSATTNLEAAGTIDLNGSGFRGGSEASSGAPNSSSTGYPVVQLQRIDNDQISYLMPANWSDASFTSNPLNGLSSGYYRLTLYTNGIPSAQWLLTTASAVIAAPTGLSATASTTSQVAITWTPVPGSAHYEIARRSGGGGFSTIASPTVSAYMDNSVTANTTYIYKVRAVDSSNNVSTYSAIDAATTILFTDDPLISGTTVVKAVHITQLRTAVNAMRAAGGLAAFTFTDPALTVGGLIKGIHVTELRTALDAARSAIGLAALSYSDTSLAGVRAKAVHFQELRTGCK
jgi:hypothetical protein